MLRRRRWQSAAADEALLLAQVARPAERADKRYVDLEESRLFDYGLGGGTAAAASAALSSTEVAKLRSPTDWPSTKKTVSFRHKSPSVDSRALVAGDVSTGSFYARSRRSWPSSVYWPPADGMPVPLPVHGGRRTAPDEGLVSPLLHRRAERATVAAAAAPSHGPRWAKQAALSWSDRRGRAADILIVQALVAEDFVDSLIERCILQEVLAVVKESVCSIVWDHLEVRPLDDLIQRLVDELIYETAHRELTSDSPAALHSHHDLVQDEVSELAADLFVDTLQAEYLLALLAAHDDECSEAQRSSRRHDFGESFLDCLILDVLLREVIHITHT